LTLSLLVPAAKAQLPSGESGADLTNGVVTVNRSGNILTVTQNGADRAIINWADFSVAAGNEARFVQPSANASTLNRVTGVNVSTLDGTLSANGNIFLINPNGILIGPGGVVTTNGFVASTLDITDVDFLDGGDMTFSGASTADLTNRGTIRALGGDVFLFGRFVNNEATGRIEALNGTVGLGAGSTIRLAEAGSERVFVEATTPGEATAENYGLIQAAKVELAAHNNNPFGLAVRSDGTIEARANAMVVDGGTVRLVSSRGTIDVPGTANISARRADGSGGAITIEGADDGEVSIDGTLDAASTPGVIDSSLKGGTIEVSGDRLVIGAGSLLDVSGSGDGGTIALGTTLAWEEFPTATANETVVEPTAELRANSRDSGNGGDVTVWAFDNINYRGIINAQSLGSDGDGGRAQVGTDGQIFLDGFADLRSNAGEVGEFTIGSANIEINSAPTPTTPTLESLSDEWVNQQLTLSNLKFSTTKEIRIDDFTDIHWNTPNNLSLIAGDRVVGFNATAGISSQGGGDITISGNADNTSTAGKSGVALTSVNLSATNGGNISITGGGTMSGVPGVFLDSATIHADTGNITIRGDEIDIINGGSILFDGSGELQFAPLTSGTPITLGGTSDSGVTTLDLTAAELVHISPNFGTTIFGSADAGNLTLAPGFDFNTSGNLELATGAGFINDDVDAANALAGVGGRYLIYSGSSSFNITRGLGAGQPGQYSSPFRSAAGFTGSGFLYAEIAPGTPGLGPTPGPTPGPGPAPGPGPTPGPGPAPSPAPAPILQAALPLIFTATDALANLSGTFSTVGGGLGDVINAFVNTDGLGDGAISQTALDYLLRFDAKGRHDQLSSGETPQELQDVLSDEARQELAAALLEMGGYLQSADGESPYPGGELKEVGDRKLHGIVFVPSAEAVAGSTSAAGNGVKDHGVGIPEFAELQAGLNTYLETPLAFATINQIIADTILHYRHNDRPVVDVYAPEQDITRGMLRLVVIEARLGKVTVTGNQDFEADFLASQIRLAAGDPVRNRALTADLDWLNRNPFRSVNLIYSRGDEIGTSNIILEVEESDPLRLFAGYENAGTAIQGKHRVFGGLNWGNVFGRDHQFAYQATYDVDFENLASHAASYTATLPWRHAMTLVGAYSDSEVETTAAGTDFGLSGTGIIGGLRYAIPLPRIGRVRHDWIFSFDYKDVSDSMDFAGTRLYDNRVDVIQGGVGYVSEWKDRLGHNSLTVEGIYSPGNLGGNNSDRAFGQSRVGASSAYLYGRARYDRLTRLPKSFSLVSRVVAQTSDGPLLNSEQLKAGGFRTVRGYNELITAGDDGIIINMEVRTPPVRVLDLFGAKQVTDQLQLLAFWDYGYLDGTEASIPQPDAELQSAGLGMRYNLGDTVSVRFDYGWQLESLSFDDNRSRAHVGVSMSY